MDTDAIRSIMSSINIDQSSTVIENMDGLLKIYFTISRAANASEIVARMVELIERAGGKVLEFSYRASDCSISLSVV